METVRATGSLDRVAKEVVDSAYRVHRGLGPGLLESVYEKCLCHELGKRDLGFRSQVSVPIHYDGIVIESGLRIDLIVDERLIIELKAVDHLLPVHTAQILTYLKLTGVRLGLLINFNVPLFRDGIRRIIR